LILFYDTTKRKDILPHLEERIDHISFEVEAEGIEESGESHKESQPYPSSPTADSIAVLYQAPVTKAVTFLTASD
jgi:hypothetical protein